MAPGHHVDRLYIHLHRFVWTPQVDVDWILVALYSGLCSSSNRNVGALRDCPRDVSRRYDPRADRPC
jgi:hypothetical protein